MEKRFRGTQEKVFISDLPNTIVDKENNLIAEFWHKHQKENAELFADALTTIQKCDLMPSELLSQRDELLKALQFLINVCPPIWQPVKEAQELINKIK